MENINKQLELPFEKYSDMDKEIETSSKDLLKNINTDRQHYSLNNYGKPKPDPN